MKLDEARNAYYEFSGKLSDINRQLSFAGIAVVWIFAVSRGRGEYTLESLLIGPLALFVLSLMLDLLHYAVACAVWGVFQWRHDVWGTNPEMGVNARSWFNWIPVACLIGKVASALVGYMLLFWALLQSGSLAV